MAVIPNEIRSNPQKTQQEAQRRVQQCDGVQAGDAVRLTKDWSTEKAGAIGIMGGMRHRALQRGSIVFRYSAFRDDVLVSCSGGPGTITTEASKLKPTGEKMQVRFWRWKNGRAGAGNGEDHTVEVSIWEWDGE